MAEPLDPKDLVTIEEPAISNMWEIAALVEVLQRKGVLTRQELYDAMTEMRKRHPVATLVRLGDKPTTRPA